MDPQLLRSHAALYYLTAATLILFLFFPQTSIATSSTKLWPLEDEKFASKEYQKCEVCQLFSLVAQNDVATFRRNSKLTKENLENYDISDVIVYSTICSPKNFQNFTNVLSLELHVVSGVCQDMALALKELDKDEEIDIIDLLNAETTAKLLCVPQFCEELWTKQEHPKNRETRAERHQRYAKEFAEWNKDQPNVISLPSGLQYKILSRSGRSSSKVPKLEDSVKVNYRGKHLDGTEFDSSYKKKKPLEFVVEAVLAGWKEAILLMSEGDMFRLYMPPALAYGAKGAGGGIIEPNEFLVFDIELLKVMRNSIEL